MRIKSLYFIWMVGLLSPLSYAQQIQGTVILVNHVGREVHVSLVGMAGSGPQIMIPAGQETAYTFRQKILEKGGVVGFVVNEEAWVKDTPLVVSRCSARFVEALRVDRDQVKTTRLLGGNMRITFTPEADGAVSCNIEDNF